MRLENFVRFLTSESDLIETIENLRHPAGNAFLGLCSSCSLSLNREIWEMLGIEHTSFSMSLMNPPLTNHSGLDHQDIKVEESKTALLVCHSHSSDLLPKTPQLPFTQYLHRNRRSPAKVRMPSLLGRCSFLSSDTYLGLRSSHWCPT